jgi:hypothetical protein
MALAAFRPDPEVIGRRLGDEYILIHLRTNRVYALNRTAARLWELLDEGGDVAQIPDRLIGEFDVDSATLADEINRLLALLRDQKLVGAC